MAIEQHRWTIIRETGPGAIGWSFTLADGFRGLTIYRTPVLATQAAERAWKRRRKQHG